MKTIVSLGQKGGAGKTTLILAIAAAAHEQGLNVVIADLDPESSNASMWHQRRQAFTEEKLPYVVASNSSNIQNLKATLESEGVDLFLIDTPPLSSTTPVEAAEHADLILMPCRVSTLDLDAMKKTRRLSDVANCKDGAQKFSVLLDMPTSGYKRAQETRQALMDIGLSVLEGGLSHRVIFPDSYGSGQTVIEYDANDKGAAECKSLFQTIRRLDCMKPRKLDDQKANEEVAVHG